MKTFKRSRAVHAALALAFAGPALIQAGSKCLFASSCLRRLTDALLLLIAHAHSCTQNGQTRVPCQDQLYLEQSDKYLITLGGHSCYTVSLQSESPLDAYFYASSEYLQPINTAAHIDPALEIEHRQLRSMETERSDIATDTRSTLKANARSLQNALICKHRYSCEATKRGISPRSIYSLVIARARHNASKHQEGASVLINLAHCDPVSFWYYVGTWHLCQHSLLRV